MTGLAKVIGGKRYDTHTARSLLERSDYAYGDFRYFKETLYVKRTGEYFLYGRGGAMSKYQSRKGSQWGWGERIIPLQLQQAMAWVSKHFDADDYEEVFGKVDEDGNILGTTESGRKMVSYRLPVAVIDRIRQEAQDRGMSMVDVIIDRFPEPVVDTVPVVDGADTGNAE